MMPTRTATLLLDALLIAAMVPRAAYAATGTFELATERYQQHDWQTAGDLFLKAATETSSKETRAAAHFYAGECALQMKDYARAQAQYEDVLEFEAAETLQIRATFRLAESLYLSGQARQAEARFRAFVEQYPRDDSAGDARNYLGEIALERSRNEEAIATFSYVIENFRDRQADRARLGMARALLATKRLDEVPTALGRLCQSDDPNVAAEALVILGRAKYESDEFAQALATFRRVYQLSVDPEIDQRAHLAAGWALWKLLRLEEVAAEVASLCQDAGRAAEYHYLLGMTAYSAKDWEGAINALELATNGASSHRAAALFYWGESALRSGNPKLARVTFQDLLDTFPDGEWADDALWGLARAAKATGSALAFDRACEQLRTQYPASDYIGQLPRVADLPENPLRRNSPETQLFEEAVSLERDGRFDAALAAYHELLEQPQAGDFRAEGIWRAARLHDSLKHSDEARKLYVRLLDEHPEFDRAAEAMANLAWIEDESGNRAAAAKHCQELTAKFPQSLQAVEASYWLAVAAADERKSDEAQWQVDWLLDRLNPASRSLRDREQRFYYQTLCLQCQLFAVENKWRDIRELLGGLAGKADEGFLCARLEFWQAEAALRLGDRGEARKRFDALVTKTVGINEPWVPMVALRRAQLAAWQEDWQDVLRLVNELDERYPEFELAYEFDYLRGRVLAGRGEMSAARTSYGHVLENEWAAGTETAAMAQWMIGESYFHQRNYALARVAYERVIERHSFPEWQARAALQAGKCAELGDDWGKATNYYSQAVERWRDTKSGKELMARLRWVEEQVAQKQATLRR